jgi:hypothetical protein
MELPTATMTSLTLPVLLQALKEDPPLDFKCRDKFLVQSVLVSSDATDANVTSMWQNIEKNAKGSIQERKIRVNFLPPSGAQTNGVSSEDAPPSYTSPTPAFGSPAPASTTEKSSALDTSKAAAVNAAEATGLAGAAAAISNAAPHSTEELKQQLAAAQAQISKLTKDLQDPQIRQRKVQEASEKMQTVVQQTQESGVTLQMTAILCLVSFLIAYLFF